MQLLQKLEIEDKNQIFKNPVEEIYPNYLKIIKTPMCFKYIWAKGVSIYLKNPELLKADINLMFSNALLYNQPNTKVHKIASKLRDSANFQIQEIWRILEKNKLKTIDEDAFREMSQKKMEVDTQFNLSID